MRPLLAAIVLAVLHAASDAPPSPIVVDMDLRLAKPALVRIESRATATVSASTIDFDEATLTAFARSDVSRLLSSGQRFPSLEAAQRTVENDLEREFVANPAPYLKLGKQVSDPYETSRVGSGWVAGADGFVVTAASALVDDAAVIADATDKERSVISEALDNVTPADLGLTTPFTDAQKAKLVDAALARVVPTIQVSSIASRSTVQLGPAVAGRQSGALVFPDAKVVVSHPAPHGTGLAVLQVPAGKLASVPLAFGSSLSPGNPVTVAGYPGTKGEGSGASSGAPVLPEAVAGTVGTAVDNVASTNAGFTAGVVGGPVLDSDGEVVGVAVKRDDASAVVPTAEIARVLDEAHVRLRTGTLTNNYRGAARDMSRHWYRKALPVLRRINAGAPDVPWVAEQAEEASQQIALGRDESPSSRPFAPIAAAAVLFALDSVAVTTVLRRRLLRARRAR